MTISNFSLAATNSEFAKRIQMHCMKKLRKNQKKKEAVPEGRASDWNSLVAAPLARRDTLLLHDARHERGSWEEHVERVLTFTLGHLPEEPLLDELVDAGDDVVGTEHEDSAERKLFVRDFTHLRRRLCDEERVDAERENTEDVVLPHFTLDAPLLVEVVALCFFDPLIRLVILFHHFKETVPADADPLIELLRE